MAEAEQSREASKKEVESYQMYRPVEGFTPLLYKPSYCMAL